MMGKWTHAICDDCYLIRWPDRQPIRLVNVQLENCCFCGHETDSGIYTREDPENTQCRGNHREAGATA